MKTTQAMTSAGALYCNESPGTGPGALLLHGNSCSRRIWDALLGGPVGRRRRLVAIDLPGHGDSPPIGAGEGVIDELAAAVAEAIASLDLAAAVVVGHSLGGHLLLEARARGGLGGVKGFCLHGAPPLGGPADLTVAFRPSAEMATVFEASPTAASVDALLASWFGPRRAAPPEAREDFFRTQAALRPALAADIVGGRLADEHAVVSGLGVPLAIFNAADDPFIDQAYLSGLHAPTLWRGAVQTIECSGHFPQWERPDVYADLLDAFLQDVYGE